MLGFKRFVTARQTLAGVEAGDAQPRDSACRTCKRMDARRAFAHQVFGLAA